MKVGDSLNRACNRIDTEVEYRAQKRVDEGIDKLERKVVDALESNKNEIQVIFGNQFANQQHWMQIELIQG